MTGSCPKVAIYSVWARPGKAGPAAAGSGRKGRTRNAVATIKYLPAAARNVATTAGTVEEEPKAEFDAERQIESLKDEVAALKKRVQFLFELWQRKNVAGYVIGRDTRPEPTQADFEWIRDTFGSTISKEEVVRLIRAGRDAR